MKTTANTFFSKTMLVLNDPHFWCDVIGLGRHFVLCEKYQSALHIISMWNYQLPVHITQVPGGVITHVTVTGCNGDESVRQSVETAAYRASPLPAPSDPALFDPNIDVTFAPDE